MAEIRMENLTKHFGEVKAVEDLNESIRLDPDYAWAHCNRGDVWLDTGKYDKAIEDYTESIRLDPKNPIPFNGGGLA